jgi:hypothetical protein
VPIAGPFDGFHETQAAVSKTCLIRFDNNKYADSDDAGRAFRLMSATCSDRSRPAVPIEVGRGGGSPAGLM